jgi:alpha,alpha-trehalose phosphorylase
VSPKPNFTIEPWQVRESSLDLGLLAQTESLFALANGHLGLRGNLDEGEPFGIPGTYLNGVYELRPLPYAEAGYGYPESGQSIINVTNGKIIRLLVDDEPFDVRYGELRSHERVLDLKAGHLHREVEWVSPAGQMVRITSTRMVSFTQRSVAAIKYEVTPVGESARVVIQSELVANEPMPGVRRDPRVAEALKSPLKSEHDARWEEGAALVHRTKASRLGVAAAMDHVVDGPDGTKLRRDVNPNIARFTVTTVLEPGEKLRLVKFLAYGWSEVRSRQALFDQVTAALTAAYHTGWKRLLAEQRKYLDDFWDGADLELDGDPEIQQAIRLGLFHVLQAGARAERRPIPAKGLTGVGYEGHAFWDSETFTLPVLTYTVPQAASDALRWRHSTLDKALSRAEALGLKGAAFPWRTINGDECSGYWPAGTAAFHINGDVAYAASHYVEATGDEEFERDVGVELLVHTARLWQSLGHFDPLGKFRIDGVTGPDEYSALADNNVYTNLMARGNLLAAADASERHPDQGQRLGVDEGERACWRASAAAMHITYDQRLGIHPQASGYTLHEEWDFAGTDPSQYPLMLCFPYFDLYRKQVLKQADLVLAMHLFPTAFTPEQKAKNFEYYERLTVRDSSLSAATQAVIAAEVGHLDLAYDYLAETALQDLYDLDHNSSDGIHIAAMAGAWSALVAGFGGFRPQEGSAGFAPRLPDALNRIGFTLCYRSRRLAVEVKGGSATYRLKRGAPIELSHHGQKFELTEGQPVTLAIPPSAPGRRPEQPPGRAPVRRVPKG